jgi:phosphate-selective porin OprO/OprP
VLDPAAIAKIVDEAVDARLSKRPPNAGWKDGFYIQSDDGASFIRVGGFLQYDYRNFVDDDANPLVDQFAFRSTRLLLEGQLFDRYAWRFMPDFAGGKLVVQDAYTDLRISPEVQLRAGKMKVPFDLERLEPEYATTFVERGLPSQVSPNRDLGVEIFGVIGGGVLEYQIGVYNGVPDGGSGDGDVSDGKEGAARVFVTPFVHGPKVVSHLGVGAAATYGQKNGTLANPDLPVFKTQGQNTFFQCKVDTSATASLATTAIADGHQWRATGQAYWYTGPIGMMGEWVRSVQRTVLGDTASHTTTDAWQGLVQIVLTGDDASYKSVTPRHPFDPKHGHWGAFDVAARIGQLTIDDPVFVDGLADPKKSAHEATQYTVGADWFLSRALRLEINVDRTTFEGGWKDATTGKESDRPAETSIIARVQTVF